MALGLAGLALSGLPVRAHRIGAGETRVFRAVNDLPDGLRAPAWVIMQAGNLAAVPAAAALAVATGRQRLAVRLALAGAGTWALSKLVKRIYRRPRPPALVRGARSRGPEPSGLGFVSGHSGVALALAAAAWPQLGPAGRAAAAATVPVVGLARIYTGAHLPLDVAGGLAMGLATEAACEWLLDRSPTASVLATADRPAQLTAGRGRRRGRCSALRRLAEHR